MNNAIQASMGLAALRIQRGVDMVGFDFGSAPGLGGGGVSTPLGGGGGGFPAGFNPSVTANDKNTAIELAQQSVERAQSHFQAAVAAFNAATAAQKWDQLPQLSDAIGAANSELEQAKSDLNAANSLVITTTAEKRDALGKQMQAQGAPNPFASPGPAPAPAPPLPSPVLPPPVTAKKALPWWKIGLGAIAAGAVVVAVDPKILKTKGHK